MMKKILLVALLFKPGNKAGFNVGAFLRVKIPIVGLYVQAEPTYTKLNVELTDPTGGSGTSNLGTNRFDLPVLLGWKMLGILRVYGGPVASWNLGSDVDWDDVDIVTEDNMSIGGQFGVGVELGPIMLDARYEGGVSHALKATGTSGGDIDFDNRGSQIILGIAYKF